MSASCKKATELMAESRERPLTWPERIRLHVHLALCLPCRRFRRQLAALLDAVRALSDEVSGDERLSAEARDRIRARLK